MYRYLDIENINLNPYLFDSKIITIQYLREKDKSPIVFKIWDMDGDTEKERENNVIASFWNVYLKDTLDRTGWMTWNPLFTYNGYRHDIPYLHARFSILQTEKNKMKRNRDFYKLFYTNTVHYDLMSYDNGYLVGLRNFALQYGITMKSEYIGENIKFLYENNMHDEIIEHAVEDVLVMRKLVNEYNIGYRFTHIPILDNLHRKKPSYNKNESGCYNCNSYDVCSNRNKYGLCENWVKK